MESQRVPGQAQMRRDDQPNPPADAHSQAQAPNFLQETGDQVKNMVQGAAEVGKGAAQGAINLARGTAMGAANIAQGAANAVKNTIGINNEPNTGTITTSNLRGGTTPNLMDSNIDVEGLTYPSNTMPGDPNYPSNRNKI